MLGFRPIADGPLTEARNAQVTLTTTITRRYATRTFVTRATDSPSQQVIRGRIAEGLRLERQLTTADGGQFGALLETRFGELQLNNADGSLDDLSTRFAADGRHIRLRIGGIEMDSLGRETVQSYASFATVYTATAGAWTSAHDVLRLPITDMTRRLRGPMQTSAYAGTGGIEGTVEITGLTRPLMFGRVFNATVQLVDPTILTYQLHSGRISLISAVYDAGVAIPFDTNYTTYAALAAATVPAGEYASSVETGYIKLGIAPIGAVTVDARGHIDLLTGNYNEATASLIRTILRDFGGLTTATELDQASFDAAVALQPADIGFFLPAGDQSTVIEVVELIAFAAGMFIGDRSGKMNIQRLDPPSTTTVHWAFDDRDILENGIEQLSLPYLVPWKSWGVGYGVNWTKQIDRDLATSVTQTRRGFLKLERRYAYVQSTNIALFHATSAGAPLRDTFFADAAVAEAEAARLMALYGYGRAMYEVRVKNALFSVHVGQTVQITYNRWNMAGGKRFVVVGVADDADKVTTSLTLFG